MNIESSIRHLLHKSDRLRVSEKKHVLQRLEDLTYLFRLDDGNLRNEIQKEYRKISYDMTCNEPIAL